MELAAAFFAFLLIAAIAAAVQTESEKKTRILFDSLLAHAPNFKPKFTCLGKDRKTGVAIDESESLLCLVDFKGKIPQRAIIASRDIVSVEIVEDGIAVTKTSRSSQAGGAIVGGALFGAAGAVVGALSGSSQSSKQVKRLDLRVVIDNVASPVFLLNFQNVLGTSGGAVHKPARQAADEWLARIQVLIRRAEQSTSANAVRA